MNRRMKAEEHFNDRAWEYESLILRMVPYDEAFFGTVLDSLPSDGARVLELGSGTGLVTELIRSRYPDADIVCIDMSPEMVEVALSKPALRGVTVLEGDMRDTWPEGRFDAVITTLCMHHLPDDDRLSMIERVRDTLNPGGVFVNGDVFRPESMWEEDLLRDKWRAHMVAGSVPVSEADGMIAKRESSYGFIDTLDGYRSKLIDAGFERVTMQYVQGFYGVFAAYR